MYSIDRQKFGTFVATLRKEKGITQKELAEQLLGNDGFEAVKITKEDMLRLLAGT